MQHDPPKLFSISDHTACDPVLFFLTCSSVSEIRNELYLCPAGHLDIYSCVCCPYYVTGIVRGVYMRDNILGCSFSATTNNNNINYLSVDPQPITVFHADFPCTQQF